MQRKKIKPLTKAPKNVTRGIKTGKEKQNRMSCTCNTSLLCRCWNKESIFTSLPVAMFLFVFSMFVAFAPLSSLRPGVNVIQSALAKTVVAFQPGVAVMDDTLNKVSVAFPKVADTVNAQVAEFAAAELRTMEQTGRGIAFLGNTIGDAATTVVFYPSVIAQSLMSPAQASTSGMSE